MIKKLLILFVFLFSSTFVYAKDKSKKLDIESVINLYGVAFSYGTPPWIWHIKDAKNILKASTFYKDQKGPSFIWEAIPVDETFETWKTIFAIKALATTENTTLTGWEERNLAIFKSTCEGVEIKYLAMGINTSLAQVVCPKSINIYGNGYNDKMGEVGIFAFLKHGNIFISHYIEWRGNAFEISNRKDWPVSEVDLIEGIKNLRKSKAFKDGSVISFKKH